MTKEEALKYQQEIKEREEARNDIMGNINQLKESLSGILYELLDDNENNLNVFSFMEDVVSNLDNLIDYRSFSDVEFKRHSQGIDYFTSTIYDVIYTTISKNITQTLLNILQIEQLTNKN